MESIEIITKQTERPYLESWYELAHTSHPWFKWRMAAVLNQLRDLNFPLDKSLQALEVGCGTCVLRSQFESLTAWTVDGTDLDYGALCRARPARGRTLYYNIQEHAAELIEAYDILILFDVLEHISDTQAFIGSLLRHLKPGGELILNVPALPALYSRFDEAVGHLKRYDKQTLTYEFRGSELEILDLRYWGFSLIPFLWLRKLIADGMRDESSEEIMERGFKSPNSAIDLFVRLLMNIETAMLKRPPLGASLLMVGRKRSSTSSAETQP